MTSEAKWPIYLLGLKSRSEVAERTLEFRFDKPAEMTFKAGQFMDLTLIDPPETDAEGNTRGFSINGAPDDSELIFTSRMRDTAFKRVLKTMPLGTKIKVEGPFGNLTLHNDVKRTAVLLAGGIGVTPFRSIVRRAVHEKLPHRIFLFYANRRPEDAAFLDEFHDLSRDNPRFTFIPTMSASANVASRRRRPRDDGSSSAGVVMFFLIDLVGALLVSGFVTAIYMAAAPGPRRRPTTSDVGGTVLPFAAGVLLAAWAGGARLPSGPSSVGAHWLFMAVFGTLGALVFAALLPMPPRHRASLGQGGLAAAHAEAASSTTGVGLYYWLLVVFLASAVLAAYLT